jgi:hypothetical protein
MAHEPRLAPDDPPETRGISSCSDYHARLIRWLEIFTSSCVEISLWTNVSSLTRKENATIPCRVALNSTLAIDERPVFVQPPTSIILDGSCVSSSANLRCREVETLSDRFAPPGGYDPVHSPSRRKPAWILNGKPPIFSLLKKKSLWNRIASNDPEWIHYLWNESSQFCSGCTPSQRHSPHTARLGYWGSCKFLYLARSGRKRSEPKT